MSKPYCSRIHSFPKDYQGSHGGSMLVSRTVDLLASGIVELLLSGTDELLVSGTVELLASETAEFHMGQDQAGLFVYTRLECLLSAII